MNEQEEPTPTAPPGAAHNASRSALPNWLVVIAAIAVIIGALAISALVIVAMVIFVTWTVGLPKELTAALITGIGGVLTLTVTRLFEQRRERAARLREKKTPVYEQFMKVMVGMFLNSTGETESPAAQEKRSKQAVAALSALTLELLVWAADPVLSRWAHYRQYGMSNPDPAGLFEFERVLYAIRRDLGHSNSGLKPGDILAFWVNDIREVLEKRPDLAKGKIS